MNWLRKLNAYNRGLMLNAEGEGGSGAAGSDAGSVLFPSEGDQAGGDQSGAGDASQQAAGDWKEYEPDPAKSDDENTAAKAEHDKTKPADDKAKGPGDEVPADGKYDLKMPDGVPLDVEMAEALGPEFKDLGLTNAQAQKLVDKYIELQQARAEKGASTPEAAWSGAAYDYFKKNGTPDTWRQKAETAEDIGKANWEATKGAAVRAVRHLGTPALGEYLDASGGGNHPELIRFMAKVGAMISEDTPASGGAEGKGKPADAAYTLFPSDAPKG